MGDVSRFELRPMPAELIERYLAEGAWDDRSLGQFLSDCLLEDPSRRFRIWSSTNSYLGTVGDVFDEARRVAGGLRDLGLGPGDIVAFQLPNWVEAAITFYACTLLGVTLVPIVHFYGPKEVGFILRQSQAKALIIVSNVGARDYLSELATTRDGLDHLERVIVVGGEPPSGDIAFSTLRTAEPLEGANAVDPDSPAVIGYTSGTTADPKGVVHTHRTLGCEVRQLADHQAERDRATVTGAPLGHAIGMLGGLLCPLYSGRPIYLMDGWDPPTVLAAMIEEDIAAGSGSTYFFTSLLDCPGFGPEHVERMRYVGLGGSPIPNAVADRADALGISLVRAYGSTEHPSCTGSQHSAPKEKRIHTDGRPMAWVEIRTVDEDGNDTEVGQPGEILSRGPERFAGYTDPTLTAEYVDADGWFRTGDVGVIDAEGYLTITDRVKDIIIRGGENVSAAEVEQLLAHMEGVAEVAVVAAPDERLGEHGCAFFRMQAGVEAPDLEAVRAHLQASGLARQKWPEELRSVDELPRTPSGKIQKFVLRERLRAGG
ncbi:MAG TPA: AMP-binding protein [Acidimicrobiales bacterium]|jgi:acyl-CoA synthetase (AMP-forming)/AMP-acid ligase II